MFVDEALITVISGNGGDGCVSFHREKFIPKGGPDGGYGGRGGSVILRADRNVGTLLALRRTQRYAAKHGQPGSGNNRTGASAPDLVIPVPVGTVVRYRASGAVVADLTADGQTAVVAAGGAGGRGNKSFATSIHQTPREYTPGADGESYELELELKLIADIGLVGLPNAGKSTILARLSAATPKIADYPFTTLRPQLGLVALGLDDAFVLADIPGLIEGAHRGAGLGHEFLRHIERTRLLAHVVDLAPADGSDPLEQIGVIERELAAFSAALAQRPRVLVGNKTDLPGSEQNAARIERETGQPVLRVSAATGGGMESLRGALHAALLRHTARKEECA